MVFPPEFPRNKFRANYDIPTMKIIHPIMHCSYMTSPPWDCRCFVKKVIVYSFETGREVRFKGGERLSTAPLRGSGGGGGSRTNLAQGPRAVVAADVTSDNGTLAVACAGSGEVEGWNVLSEI